MIIFYCVGGENNYFSNNILLILNFFWQNLMLELVWNFVFQLFLI
jgi:hypothetical protein